jgi:multiple sugar transport system ATP-binding protein
VVNGIEPMDRDIAMVFQSYALYPQMTVRQNMGYALELRHMPRVEIARMVTETAAMLSLEAQLDKLPKQLSGGQRQRVALGRAIVRHPQAFLFDEPLSNLDAKLRGEMRVELKAIQARLATTAVYVTHDQIEAMTLGDRITVMHQGEIQQIGSPMDIYDRPCNRFVASFIGSPQMNMLPGIITEDQEGFRLDSPAGQIRLAMPGAKRLHSANGTAVVLGLRPEHIRLEPRPYHARLSVRVTAIELMGDHQCLHAEANGVRLVLSCPGEVQVRSGTVLTVHLDTARGHVFAAGGDEARNLTVEG